MKKQSPATTPAGPGDAPWSAIATAIVFPFLAVLTLGMVFDKKDGGDPFYATTFSLFFLSPLWLLLGVGLAVAARRNPKVSRFLQVADAVLLLVIAGGIAVIRMLNSR